MKASLPCRSRLCPRIVTDNSALQLRGNLLLGSLRYKLPRGALVKPFWNPIYGLPGVGFCATRVDRNAPLSFFPTAP